MRVVRLFFVLALVLGVASPAVADPSAAADGGPAGQRTAERGKDCPGEAAATAAGPLRTASLPGAVGAVAGGGPQVTAAQRIAATQFFSTAPCEGVRPGAPIIVEGLGDDPDSGCTANFIYRGVDARRRATTYIGTAGHCILPGANGLAEDVGEKAWAPGKGPEVTLLDGRRIGEMAYAVHMNSKDLDFALIRIDRGVGVSAQMCHFGGPTTISKARNASTTQLHLVGDGTVIGWYVPARTFVATSLANPTAVTALGAAMLGDSGGPIIDGSGRAVGVLVGLGARWNFARNEAGYVEILRLPHMIARAEKVLKQRITMRTAPLR